MPNLKRILYYDDKIKNIFEKDINKLLIGRSFKYVGTFSRKMKYITDIDVSNFVYSKKCSSFEYFVYNQILDIIKNLPPNIKLLYLTTGYHTDLKPEWVIKDKNTIINYDYKHTKEILKLLKKHNKIDSQIYDKFNLKTPKPNLETLILLEELIDKKSRLTWKMDELIKGEKDFLGKKFYLKSALFTQPLKNFFRFLWKYSEDEYILVDISIYFKGDLQCIKSLQNIEKKEKNIGRDRSIFLMYYNNEYYWLLRETRYIFYKLFKSNIINKKQLEQYTQSIVDITENKAGKYKYIYNKLLDYYKLIRNNCINIKLINKLIKETFNDVKINIKDDKIINIINNYDLSNKSDTELIDILKKISSYINNYLNSIMYDKMMYYYNIIFELDSTIKKRLPPITNMKLIKHSRQKINYRYF